MFMSEVNYTAMEFSPQDEISNSDVENLAMSPDDNRIDVVNVEQLAFDDRSSVKSARNGDCARSWTMAKVQVGYDITRKGERSLVVDGFKFTKSRDGTNNRVFWRCSRRECKATAVTVCDKVEHVRAIHAHEPPLAAEFFGSQEGVSQRCQLQEVRFNTSAANMRPRYRRSTISGLEGNGEDSSTTVKDISNSTGVSNETKPVSSNQNFLLQSKPVIGLVTAQPIFQIDQKSVYSSLSSSEHQRTPSVKEQVREFILRNSNAQQTQPGGDRNVSVAQFLISPAATQAQFIQTNALPASANSSSTSGSSAVFNFNTMQIKASSSSDGSDQSIDTPSLKSTPGAIPTKPMTPQLNEIHLKNKPVDGSAMLNQLNLEQIIHIILNKNGASRQRSCSDSEWLTGTSSQVTSTFEQDPQNISPSTVIGGQNEVSNSPTPSRFIHWKKEKLRESETSEEQFKRERKRRHDDTTTDIPITNAVVNGSIRQSAELCSFLNSFCPTITHKLMGVMQKLSSELCPEEAVAQEVFEKCTAIKTCLETLEKLHSLMTY